MKRILILASLALFLAFNASAQKMIDVKDAAKHVGETLTVCGKVFSTKLITPSNMTFLDLTVVIKGEDRSKFTGQPEVDFKDKAVCVTGTIIDYKGKPEIVLSDPKDIKLDTK
jgi:micrococcal nuclease